MSATTSSPATLDNCGCCSGLDAETPQRIDNPPGLDAVSYRIGEHARFKESLLAKLSSAGLPALSGLTTREDNDFTLALCDAVASTLDVLSFYQERIANENFLRTATERRSILELARLIGYDLAPGVAASTWLAFNLQEVPGVPALAAEPVTLPVGVKVQSVPGQDEVPQTFETVETVEARVEWNAIPAQANLPWHPKFGDKTLWLAGVGTGVQAGDVILIVGQERIDAPGSKRWDIRLVTRVTEDKIRQRTRLEWGVGLGSVMPHVEPASAGAAVYVFRQRAALFGHNAPDPRILFTPNNPAPAGLTCPPANVLQWSGFTIGRSWFDLDTEYSKIVPGSWIALIVAATPPVDPSDIRPREPVAPPSANPAASDTAEGCAVATPSANYKELYRVGSTAHLSRRDFGLSGKITRIVPEPTENLARFCLRETSVLAQSEPLSVAETPLGYPLYGGTLGLSRLEPDIAPGRVLAVSGKRARIRLRSGKPDVDMKLDDDSIVIVSEGDSLRLAGQPEEQSGSAWNVLTPADFAARINASSNNKLRLSVLDRSGKPGTLKVAASAIEQVAALDDDESVQEIVFIDELATAVVHDRDQGFTSFTLAAALKHCYDRDSARVNANVARATHGETVTEVLGSGNARVANARFALRQPPLTYVSAATPSGRQSTLQLRANDMLWTETPSLYARGPTERVYEIANDDAGNSSVLFGDGVEGARLPSGDHNLRADYRKGLGLGGNVAAGKLTTLLTRPLGLAAAVNPEAASGGEDAEREDQARGNAPLTVLTLDRAVSVRDYRDYARAFAGIAKAHALWIPNGPARGVFITVAGENGAAIDESGDTYLFLLDSLHLYGDPLMPVRIVSFRDARFRLRMAVKVAADADAAVVMPAVETALKAAFDFAARDFGQGVSVDEAVAVAHRVVGVEAVQVVELHRVDAPSPGFQPRLFAALPLASLTDAPLAAELLVLDAAQLTLEPMP